VTTPTPEVHVEIVGRGHAAALHAAALEHVPGVSTPSERPKRFRLGNRGRSSLDPLRAVIVATPPRTHEAIVGPLLDAGVPVLVERPSTSALAAIDRLRSLDRGRGLFRFGENLLAAPLVRSAIELARTLDSPTLLSIRDHRPRPDWGLHGTPEFGGGVLFERGISAVAIALELLTDDVPVAVTAQVMTAKRRTDGDGMDDRAKIRLRFARGLVAVLELDWSDTAPLWELQTATDNGSMRVELLPEPHLEIDGADRAGESGANPRRDEPLDVYGYVAQLTDFVQRVRRGDPQRPGVDLAHAALGVIVAAAASARAKAEVDLPFGGPAHLTPYELLSGATSDDH